LNEVSPELLEQLRDIHAATEPGWWPPAPGWWVLATVLLALLAWLLVWLAKRWVVRRRRNRLLAALAHIQSQYQPGANNAAYLAELSKLFRVIAVRAFPGTASARLQGRAWVEFLRSLLPEAPASSSLDALETGPYQPAPEFDVDSLNTMAREWVKRYG
jgi:hypothetical protein